MRARPTTVNERERSKDSCVTHVDSELEIKREVARNASCVKISPQWSVHCGKVFEKDRREAIFRKDLDYLGSHRLRHSLSSMNSEINGGIWKCHNGD